MDTPQYDASPNVEQTLEELLESSDRYTTLRRQMADLDKKVDQLMELMAGNARGKKRSQEEASVSETPPAARVRVDAGAETIWYIAKAKEPSIPLPDTFDGNPKHLKKFLSELDLCFRVAPSKYAGDDAKVITAGRLCSDKKVYPWWNTWLTRWKQKDVGFQTWEDFERGIRSEFKDHLEKKDARAKLKRTKQTNKVREYISLMQSLNIDARYDEEFLWETIYDGLKPKLKEMWATIVSPPEDLQEKYATLVKLGAVVEDNEAEQKKNASSSSAEAGDDEKKKKRRRKEKKKKSECLTASS